MFFNRTSDKLQLSEELVGSGQCCPLCQVMSCHVTIIDIVLGSVWENV